MHITFDPFDPADRRRVAQFTETLVRGLATTEVFWANLRARLSSESLLPLIVRAAEMGRFRTIADLLPSFPGVRGETLYSWHRNLGRSIKAANTQCGTTIQVWTVVDGAYYEMDPDLRRAILATDGN